MSNPFSYLRQYEELTTYLEAVEKIKNGKYIPDLEEIKKVCLNEYSNNISWGDKGLECFPEAQVLFKVASELNEFNKNPDAHSEASIQSNIERRKTLERLFEK